MLLHVVASALNNSTQCFVNGRHDHLPNGKPRAIASCRRNTLCRKECCSSCSTRHGIGLHHFVNRVRLEANQTVAVLAVGNSVARWDDYATARAFVESVNNHAMENHWATSVPLSFDSDGRHALGATEPERLVREIQSSPVYFNRFGVIILQYNFLFVKARGETLLRALLQLPQRPLVLAVQHCEVSDFIPRIGVSGQHFRAVFEEDTRRWSQMVEHYNLPTVNTCFMVKHLLAPEECNSLSAQQTTPLPLKALESTLYADPFHFNGPTSALIGCLLADLLINAQSNRTGDTPVHANSLSAHGARNHQLETSDVHGKSISLPLPLSSDKDDKFTTRYMLSAQSGNLISLEAQGGWSLTVGGKDHSKAFMYADQPGASMTVALPPCTSLCGKSAPRMCSRVVLDFYKHHSLPMGVVEVELRRSEDGTRLGRRRHIDACCEGACVEGAPTQGFYFSEIVGSELNDSAGGTHGGTCAKGNASQSCDLHLVIRLISRNSTRCSAIGNQFSITSISTQVECSESDFAKCGYCSCV